MHNIIPPESSHGQSHAGDVVRLGRSRYISEYAAKAWAHERGVPFDEVMRVCAKDVRNIRGVRYVDEITFHREVRACEQARKAPFSDDADTGEVTQKKKRSAKRILAVSGVALVAIAGVLYVTSWTFDLRLENTFSHSARTIEESSYSSLAATPGFLFADILALLKEEFWFSR